MRLVRVAAAVAVGVAVLAGCSDDGTANQTLPSTSSTPTETTESLPLLGPPDLPMPNEARDDSPESVSTFIEYYISLVNRAGKDLDSQYLRQFAKSCTTCTRIADETDSDLAAGYSYVGGELSVQGDVQAAITGPGTAEAAFVADQAALQLVDKSGAPVPGLSFPALTDLPSGAAVAWSDSLKSWLVSELTLG